MQDRRDQDRRAQDRRTHRRCSPAPRNRPPSRGIFAARLPAALDSAMPRNRAASSRRNLGSSANPFRFGSASSRQQAAPSILKVLSGKKAMCGHGTFRTSPCANDIASGPGKVCVTLHPVRRTPQAPDPPAPFPQSDTTPSRPPRAGPTARAPSAPASSPRPNRSPICSSWRCCSKRSGWSPPKGARRSISCRCLKRSPTCALASA